ncbi:Pentatricopeptide repeat (PPR) superfamily protein isoform 2 [Hibiscus syriacus]|uniref:Pentatricopeptide repeat (PPR) superfamily protein isoform 2 n=1 Tax=Hibiscus syriacus TaxID=106335 RepID=A0A6A3CJ56_HIBSY|nr:Pentatricopeptide repeat (PPR) superfamily protein isoform 2 [Hibiscus syriacus]
MYSFALNMGKSEIFISGATKLNEKDYSAFIDKIKDMMGHWEDSIALEARVSWEKICFLKSKGWLGMKDIKCWNKACLLLLVRSFFTLAPALHDVIMRWIWSAIKLGAAKVSLQRILFFEFVHNEKTCKEMAFVLAKGNNLNGFWIFLEDMSRSENGRLVTTPTVTCLIKVLGEQGYYCVVNEIDKGIEMMQKMQRMNHGIATNRLYALIIHALCEAGRVLEAKDFLFQLVAWGSIPRYYTYKLVCDALNSAGETNLIDDELHRRIREEVTTAKVAAVVAEEVFVSDAMVFAFGVSEKYCYADRKIGETSKDSDNFWGSKIKN